MAETDVPGLLKRKIAAARPRAEPVVLTAERAAGLAVARVAEQMMQLPVTVLQQGSAVETGAEIVETLPEQALLAMLEGPKDGLGLAILDTGMLAVLIEMMTLGRLLGAEPAGRRPTRIDAAMVAGFLDAVLGQFETILAAEEDVIWAGGFRYASHLADARPLGLMLDEPGYRVLRLGFGMGLAASGEAAMRRGEMTLVLPANGRGRGPIPVAAGPEVLAARGRDEAAGAQWEAALQAAVMAAPTTISAVLGRVTLPLADVLRLEAGVSLPLPMAALKLITVETEDGTSLCLAQLGQGNGRRALRIDLTPGADWPEGGLPVQPTEVITATAQPLQRPAPRPSPDEILRAPAPRPEPVEPMAAPAAEGEVPRQAQAG